METGGIGPIFVVGSPRTGTTLTREILTLHPDVYVYDEMHYCERVYDVVGGQGGLSTEDLDRALDNVLTYSRWSFAVPQELRATLVAQLPSAPTHAQVMASFLATEAKAHGAGVWGDSSPQDVLYMPVLKDWFPTARFVGVVRDPRAFLASYKNYYKKGIKKYRNRFNAMTNSLLWRSYMNTLHEATSSPLSRDLMLLKYETLVSDPDSEVKRLCDFLGLDFRPEMLQVQRRNSSYIAVEEDKKQAGINPGSIDRWRETLNRAELWILERICADTMRKFGYEPVGVRLGLRDLPQLIEPTLQLPGRLFNLLFRSRKPFTLGKLKRVLRR